MLPLSPEPATQLAGTLSGHAPTGLGWLQPPPTTTATTQQSGASITAPTRQDEVGPLHPFNNPSLPPIPIRILKVIKAGGYIELGDLLPEALLEAFDLPTHKESKEEQSKHRFKITSILEWGLAFATYASAITHWTPERATQLIAYSGIIFRLAREVEGSTWQRYDKAFRQTAAINPSLRWDQRQPDIWLASLAGSGPSGIAPGKDTSSNAGTPPPAKRAHNGATAEACHRWNRGECFARACKFSHSCIICQSPAHTARECSILRPSGPRSRPRSTLPPVTRNPMGSFQ